MTRTPAELDEPIRKTVNNRAILLSHTSITIIVLLHMWIVPGSSTIQKYVLIPATIFFFILGFLRVFDLINVNKHPLAYVLAYNILIFLGVLALPDPNNPYILLWFMAVFITNLYYGSRGVWWTVNAFGIATIARLLLAMHANASFHSEANIVVAWLLLAAICSFFVNLQKVFDWDREKLKATAVTTRTSQQRLEALINNLTESVLVLDDAHNITLYNAAALGLLDTNQILNNRKLDEFARIVDAKNRVLSSDDLLKDVVQPVTRTDLYLAYDENDKAALSTTITPIRTAYGESTQDGFIITLRDITREKSLEEERDEFISVISHELRTPVSITEANISNAMLVFERKTDSDSVKKSLANADNQVVFLASMLNDLTTFARAEQGTLKLTAEGINISNFIGDLTTSYQKQASDKGLVLAQVLDPSIPSEFISSPLYIREVLQNFIVNAIKYSDKGTVTIKASGTPNGEVRFDVSDQGIGISTSDQQKVFNKFFRAEDYRTRATSGTGLGLYIVRKLADVLRARIELNSEVGKGSTFSLVIPSHPAAASETAPPTQDK